MFAFTKLVAVSALIAAPHGPALALLESPSQQAPAGGFADVRLAQAKKSSGRDTEALYRQCREAVVRTYGRSSGLRDPNQDPLNAEMRMQEAATLDSKIDHCVQNGGRP